MNQAERIYSITNLIIDPFFRTMFKLDPMTHIKKRVSKKTSHLWVDIGAFVTLVIPFLLVFFLEKPNAYLLIFIFSYPYYRCLIILSCQYDAFTKIMEGRKGERSIIGFIFLGLMNILEYCFLFATIYKFNNWIEYNGGGSIRDCIDFIYFSIITQLTVGYGDIHPVSYGKILVFFQGVLTLITVIAYFPAVFSFGNSKKQSY